MTTACGDFEDVLTTTRKKDSGDGTTWEKKKRKTEAEMDGQVSTET